MTENTIKQKVSRKETRTRIVSLTAQLDRHRQLQNLSNKLGVNVMAPNGVIWAFPNGDLTIGPTPAANSGSFSLFLPGGNRL